MFTIFMIADLILLILGLVIVLPMLFNKDKKDPAIKFTFLNEQFIEQTDEINKHIHEKENNIKTKAKEKKKRELAKKGKRVYLLNFKGGVFAAEVENLRKEITAVLSVTRPQDEILINIDSPGGTVVGYGLVASELDRIKRRGIKLTAMVDKVAASGGYMAAVVADKIYAAPFAYIGSIGVVQEFPNFSKILNKYGIEWKTYTAGESKRDVGQYGKITPDAERRLNKRLVAIHGLFKDHITKYRKQVNIKKIATGECWTAAEALDLKLVDGLAVSDDVILEQIQLANVYKVETPETKSKLDKLLDSVVMSAMTQLKRFVFEINTEKLM